MLFNVLHELRQGIGAVNEYELREAETKVDDVLIRNLEGTVRFLRTDRGLLARVRALGTMDEECSRCLHAVLAPVEIDFEEEYVPEIDADTGTPLRTKDVEDAFRISPRFELDLREGLRQYILISEPAKPLCKAECAGLCTICGADLNAGPHECEQATDERWSTLAGLKNETPEGS